ncbi:MAG: hypothetical protein ACOCXH_05435 [Cyclobacteriaceae bacterium]
MIRLLAKIFDRVFTKKNVQLLDTIVLVAAIISFLVHLFLIYLVKNFDFEWSFMQDLSHSYLSAIYTPFSFIIFYEVVLIIEAVPREFPLSIGKQYEVITLILIRRVFKDISEFDSIATWNENAEQMFNVGLDLLGSLLLFFLVGLFYKIYNKNNLGKPKRQQKLIDTEKAIGSLLLLIFVILSIYSLYSWTIIHFHLEGNVELGHVFYKDFFGIMVFFDVLLLLISFIFYQGFVEIFRNAGFVLTVIIIRISFFAPQLYNVILLVSAVFTGMITLWLFYQYRDHFAKKEEKEEK